MPPRRYVYRREPTVGGVERMQRGELEHFDLEMYANLNTGVLEEYLDEKNRREGFAKSVWSWPRILVGVAVGCLFALINTYVGLKIGLIVYGAWYVAYLVGMGFRWRPAQINLSAGAANGAAFIVTGFVYVFPAIWLLSDANGGRYDVLVPSSMLPGLAVAAVATVISGLLGVTYFIVFRRVWLVEDPLPYPSFESFVKLLDMTNDLTVEAASRARHAVALVATFTGVSALFAFLRDFPLVSASGARVPVMAAATGGSAWYADGAVQVPTTLARYSWANFALSPLLLATGWFMRSKAALLVAMGTFFVWFVAIPLAVVFNVPVFRPALGGEVGLDDLWAAGQPSALLAFGGVFRTMAAGALLGGGLTALLKMAPTIASVTKDLVTMGGGGAGAKAAYVPGRGWYEWPPVHILVMIAVALVALPATFVAGGYPLGASVAFALVLVLTSFLLGAIACKVLGETSIEPVSGTSFIVFLLLFGVFRLMDLPVGTTVVLGLLGTSVYASAIAMTGDILLDFKNALYVGTTPASQVKAAMAGLVPGAIAGVLAATLLSRALADGTLALAAPQANAFATLVSAIVGGQIDYTILLLGLAFGVFVEVLTGMGTAFGLGMFLPVGIVAPLVVGGVARDLWERRLDRAAGTYGWSEEKKTIRLLDTYMIATGLIVGEAIVGTITAVYLSAGLVVGG